MSFISWLRELRIWMQCCEVENEKVLPLIHNIMQEYQPEEPTDADAKVEPIVDHGAIVQGFLTNPNKKLILRCRHQS